MEVWVSEAKEKEVEESGMRKGIRRGRGGDVVIERGRSELAERFERKKMEEDKEQEGEEKEK